MAQIDVTELLSDPDFVDQVTQIKRIPTVDLFGRNNLSEEKFQTIGCVQPASGRTLAKLPEAFRVANVSSFWIKGVITATSPGKYSDILVFKGMRYQIQTVFDWSNFGAGYSEGTCVAEVPS